MTRKDRAKRDKMLDKLYKIANQLGKKYSRDAYNKMWTMCSDWNSEHFEDGEIFMCEDYDEDGKFRYYIEDDYFYLAD